MPMPATNCSGEGAWTAWQTCRCPSVTHPHRLPSPLLLAPLNPSPLRSSMSVQWEKPCSSEPGVGAAWPKRQSHPGVCGLQEASQADSPLWWAPGCQPLGHLQASAALPCSSPAPKQALGSSGGSRAPPPSRALRFFDIWSVFGSWVSPLSLSPGR